MNIKQIEQPYRQYMYAYPHKKSYRSLHKIDIRDYLHHLNDNINHLYIHLPFCETKCGFCNLFSLPNRDTSYIDKYLITMENQLIQYGQLEDIRKAKFSSLVVGGGTPLFLDKKQIEKMFSLVENYLPIKVKSTYTVIETSPNQSELDKLELIYNRGIDRISIGVQSFKDEELKTLKRFHSVQEARNALTRIKKVGFKELNVDLIYGIPGQTTKTIKESIYETLNFNPQEIFIYPLYLREGTAMYKLARSYQDTRMEMYHFITQMLTSNGYEQTSMRRFVLSGMKQATDCGFDNTLALGCGGRSYLGNLHFCEPFATHTSQCKSIVDDYIQKDDFYYATHGCILNEDEQKRRYTIKHLLYYQGINQKEYSRLFNSNIKDDFPFIQDLIQSAYLIHQEDYLRLSSQGIALSDYIGPMFISDEVKEKMDFYQL